MKLFYRILVVILNFPLFAYANKFDDGNTVGGFFLRMYLTVKAFLSESISVAMLIGIITLIGGLTHIAYANKRQISPRFGAVLCIVGFAFMSPKGCSNMATREVLNTETQVVYEILEQNDSFVSPNE